MIVHWRHQPEGELVAEFGDYSARILLDAGRERWRVQLACLGEEILHAEATSAREGRRLVYGAVRRHDEIRWPGFEGEEFQA